MSLFLNIIGHEFLLIVALIIPFILVLVIPKVPAVVKVLMGMLMTLAFLNVFLGSMIANPLIYRYGVEGEAVVTRQEKTSNLHNSEPVVRFYTTLTTAEGEAIETYFESWDFNVYPRPEGGRYAYPQQGESFRVRYLPDDPDQFVILAE